MISTQDVTFDKLEKYDPLVKESDLLNKVIKTIRVPNINKSYNDLNTDEDEFEYTFTNKESTLGPVSGLAFENTSLTTTLSNNEDTQILTLSDNSTQTLEGQTITPQATPNSCAQPTGVAPIADQNIDSGPVNPPPDLETV